MISRVVFFFFFITLVSGQPYFQLSPRKGFSAPTEGMLNLLWPRLEPGWRTVQLYLLYHQATSAWLSCYSCIRKKKEKKRIQGYHHFQCIPTHTYVCNMHITSNFSAIGPYYPIKCGIYISSM